MPQTLPQPQPEAARTPVFERTPWVAREMVLEEPRREPEPPLRLAVNEHLVEATLDGEAIRRER
jgi:hypothetical protein